MIIAFGVTSKNFKCHQVVSDSHEERTKFRQCHLEDSRANEVLVPKFFEEEFCR